LSVAYHRTVSWARVGRLLRDDGPLGGALAAVALAAAWVATWRPQVDPDAWWHLALGESIAAAGALPPTEPFSWLTAGDRFVAHSWLWDLLLAGAWRVAGATGTSLLVVPATAFVVWLVWELIGLVARPVPPLGRAALVLVAMVVALPLWAPRAQTLDVGFILATILVLARYLHLGARRGLVALPLIGLLWANLHGSAILGLPATIALAIVALPIGVRWGVWPRRPFVPVVAAGVAGIAATVVNPYGPRLLAYPFERDVASAFTPTIAEWQSPNFGPVELWLFRAMLAGVLLVAMWFPGRSRDPFLHLAAAAWTFAALGSVRFLAIAGPLLVVAAAPAVGASVGRWLGVAEDLGVGAGERDRQSGETRESAVGAATDPRAAIAVAAIAIAGIVAAGWLIIDPARQDAAIESRLPVAALAALEAGECTARLLPAYGWAGYVIWATGREVGAYGNSAQRAVTEQARLEAVSMDPRSWLDEHAVGAVLMPADGPLTRWLDEADGWDVAYRDAQATVHVRTSESGCPVSPS
jgi:hypothetical protein